VEGEQHLTVFADDGHCTIDLQLDEGGYVVGDAVAQAARVSFGVVASLGHEHFDLLERGGPFGRAEAVIGFIAGEDVGRLHEAHSLGELVVGAAVEYYFSGLDDEVAAVEVISPHGDADEGRQCGQAEKKAVEPLGCIERLLWLVRTHVAYDRGGREKNPLEKNLLRRY